MYSKIPQCQSQGIKEGGVSTAALYSFEESQF